MNAPAISAAIAEAMRDGQLQVEEVVT